MANVSFKKGLLSALPAAHAAGTFYVTTDERAMYLDVDDSTRIRIGDFQEFDSIESLKANVNPSTSALYYVTGANCLAKWNGTDYIQINLDTGMTSVEVTGTGNAVTGASYNAATRKLTLTMGASYETADAVNAKIDAKTGSLVHNDVTYDTIAEFVNAKTAGIATDAALGDLQNRVLTAEGEIDALQDKVGEKTVSDQIDEKIEALKLADTYEARGSAQAVKDELTDIVNGKADASALTEEINRAKAAEEANAASAKAAKDAADAAQGAADKAQEEVDAVEGRVATVEGQVTTLIGEDAGKSVRAIANEELAAQLIPEAAKESLDTLSEIAAWIQSHPDDASAMNAAVAALQDKVDTGDKTVSAYVADAIAALSIGDYAKAADLAALAGRVAEVEGKAHEHANKALLDTYAQTEADLSDAVAKKHAHENAEELAKIADGDVAKWNAAQANAEQTAANALATAKGELQASIDAKANAADVYAKTETYTQSEVNAKISEANTYTDTAVANAALVWGSF